MWAKKMAANRVLKCRSCWSRNRRRKCQRRKEKREERRRKVVNDEGVSKGGLAVGKAVRDMPIGDMGDVRGFSDPSRSLMDMSVAEYSAVDFPPSLLLLDLLD